MKARTRHSAPKYEYHYSEAEVLFKTVVNFKTKDGKPDWEKYKDWQEKSAANDGYCLCSVIRDKNHECMCLEFRNSMEEAPCHCGVYTKIRRNEKEVENFSKKLEFDENSKVKKNKKADKDEVSPEDFETDE